MAAPTGKAAQRDGDGFVHLHVHSNYTLSCGASTLGELLARARELGMQALALTDTNALYGSLHFYKLAREMGVKPIIGAVLDDPADPGRYAVLLARNRAGYSELCRAITDRQLKDKHRLSRRLAGHSSPADEPGEPDLPAESGGATFSLAAWFSLARSTAAAAWCRLAWRLTRCWWSVALAVAANCRTMPRSMAS